MPKLWVKDAGTWKQVKQMWIKDDGVWKSPTAALINDNGIGKQFYPDSTPTAIYSGSGTYSYTVPFGVTTLQIKSPLITGMNSQNITVTPGQILTISCGNYNSQSTVTGTGVSVTIPAYSKTVFTHSSGNIDNTLTQTFTVATTNVANASTTNTTQGPSSTNLNVNGIFFQTNGEGNQGDFQETVQISTVPISTLVGVFTTVGEITSSRGQSSATIEQQPSGANSWRARFTVTEFGYSNFPVAFRINIQQQGWVQITPLNSNIVTYNTPGTYTFTVPAGVTSINANIVGGGGGGSSANSGCNYGSSNSGGGGGGSGGYRSQSISVTPGENLNIVVGAGGAGGDSASTCYYGTNGANGGNSSIQALSVGTLTATGGTGATVGWEFNGGPAFGGNQANGSPGTRNGGYGGLPGGNNGAFGGNQGSPTNGAGGASPYSNFGKGGNGGRPTNAGTNGGVVISYGYLT